MRATQIDDVLDGRARWCVVDGDCLDVLPTIERVDHVITDPPYDARTHKNAATQSTITREHRGVSFGALESPAELAETLLRPAARWVIAFCALEQLADYASGAGDGWVRAGVWDKIAPAPQISGDRPGQAVEGIAIMHAPGRKRWNRGGGGRHLATSSGPWDRASGSSDTEADRTHAGPPLGLLRSGRRRPRSLRGLGNDGRRLPPPRPPLHRHREGSDVRAARTRSAVGGRGREYDTGGTSGPEAAIRRFTIMRAEGERQ
jgi:hypothetical protein